MKIAGYAALFDVPDRGGDVIRKGAFKRAAKAGIPLLWQHDRTKRIGFVESLKEDERGLQMIAEIDDTAPQVMRGGRIHEGQGLSFGYRVNQMARSGPAKRYRELTDLDLIEVSLVTQPMQPHARILAIG